MKINILAFIQNRPFLLGLTTALLTFNAGALYAQDGDVLEEVVVTGSRISRDTYSSISPIDTFDAEALTKSGQTSIDEFLKDIPAFTGFQLGATTNNGGDGGKFVDMRGLEFKRTLILINGRRQVGSFASGTSDIGAVDLNSIPWHMVKRVEVLKDGASTVYGSDAIAGVVNLILQDDFEGFELSGDYGVGMENGDAENYGVSMLAGAGNDRGHVTASLGYNRQNEMLQGERDWAHDALWPILQADGTFQPEASGSSNSRRIRGLSPAAVAAAGGATNFIVDETTGLVRPFVASDVYNYAPVNALQTPYELWQFATTGHYRILDDTVLGDVEAYMEAMYTKRTSHQRLAPDASFGVDPAFSGGLGVHWNDQVPAENPFNPFGDNPNNPWGIVGEDVRLNRRFEESGGRLFRQAVDTYRMVGGLTGELDTNNLKWDLSYTYAESEKLDETKFYHRFDRWETLVTPSLCSADSSCLAVTGGTGNFNPFAPFGSITPEQMAFLSANSLKDNYLTRLITVQFNVTGDTENLVELPGGPIGWAIGYEHRDEFAQYNPDEFVSEGLTTGGAGDPLEGGFNVNEFYAEFSLPFVSGQPWMEDLTLEASVRHSEYNTSAGNSTNYGTKLNWAPNNSFRLRGTYSTGFRAPNIVELYSGDATDFPIAEHLCEFADTRTDITDTIRTNCLNEGYPGDAGGELGFAWQSAYTTLAPDSLQPEESKTFTVGVIATPEMVPGLSASLDYWNIEVDNWIAVTPYNALFRSCVDSVNYTAPSCAFFLAGDPIDFFPNDATAPLANQGLVKTDGLDLSLTYTRSLEGTFFPSWVSAVNASFLGTWVNSRTEEFPLTGSQETVGTADGFAVYPELKFNTTLGLEGDNWYFAWKTNYIGETDDRHRPAEITDDAVAESVLYHDISGSYTYKAYTLMVGINNLADQDPPRFHSAFNANTEPGAYDVIGRRFWMSAKITF